MTIDSIISRCIKKFFLLIEIQKNGCWFWKGCKTPEEYGYFYSLSPRTKKRIKLAHRFSFELFNGEIKDGYFVCHKCDIPSCVNPDHLFQGSQKDNMKDKVSKGRQVMGEKMHNCKLNWDLVHLFRKEYSQGISCTNLSKKYGFHESTIADVVKNRSWKGNKNDRQIRSYY